MIVMKNSLPKNLRVYILSLAVCLLQQSIKAQDPVFSQPFLSPIYLNPAATGAAEYDWRVSAIHRRQWWTIPSQMNYTAVSIDKFFPEISSGFGLLGTNSVEGYLKKTGIYGSYAYTVCAGTESAAANGGTPRWFWTGGIQFGAAQRRIDYSKLVFSDQLNTGGIIPGSVSAADPPGNNGKMFLDFAAGMFFNYNCTDNSRLLVGFSAHHINRPDESLTNSGDTALSQLPVRWSGNLIYSFTNPEQTWSFSAAFLYYKQASHQRFQTGIEVRHNDYDVSLGAWYHGGKFNFADMNTLSITLSFNLFGRNSERDKIRMGLAHDAQIGNNTYSYRGGSSEIGMIWEHQSYNQGGDNPCKPKISSQMECPRP
jgi:type IX secretion system PorP/SprF family membrane protein